MFELLDPIGGWLKGDESNFDWLKTRENVPEWLKTDEGMPDWFKDALESYSGQPSETPATKPDYAPREPHDIRQWLDTYKAPDISGLDLVSGLNAMTWGIVGETMGSSIQSVRSYGERFDELDAERDNRMREYLGRSIREQFDLDLETIACRLATLDETVAPEELALINGALGTDFDEAALRERAKSTEATSDDEFFSTPPQSFVAAVVYDNYLFAETKNADDSCAELLLRTLKTLCEEILICDGGMADDEVARFTSLMTAVQELLVEQLDSWEGKPRISTLALSPSYDGLRTGPSTPHDSSTSAASAQEKAAGDTESNAEAQSEAAKAEEPEDEATR